MRKVSLSLLLCLLMAAAYPAESFGQIVKLPKIDIPGPVKDAMNRAADALLNPDKQPVTTSFADARNEIALPDTFEPQTYGRLSALPRTENGGFILEPGAWQEDVLSYCLKAGTYGPGEGDGYLPARLEGPKADVVQCILEQAPNHPEIQQQQVQALLWAIIAQNGYEEMPEDMQRTAETLLTRDLLRELQGGWKSYLYDVPPIFRPVLRGSLSKYVEQVEGIVDNRIAALSGHAQNIARGTTELRRRITESPTYDRLEDAAVLTGLVPDDPDAPVVPRGRWAAAPNGGGYFIRYLPHSYSSMTVQVYVPARSEWADSNTPPVLNLSESLAMPANGYMQRLAPQAPTVEECEYEVASTEWTSKESCRPPTRDECFIQKRTDCVCEIAENPEAVSEETLIEADYYSQVNTYNAQIELVSDETGIDADLIRAIMYHETTHGYLDWFPERVDMNKSILPMNINIYYWGDLFGTREYLEMPTNNIRAGADMLQRIMSCLPDDAPISHIASLYIDHKENQVNKYGKRVEFFYNSKPWLKEPR